MGDMPPDKLSFEQALAELEAIVRILEDGKISLEDSLAQYERGMDLLKRCYGQLQVAEQKILLLAGTDEQGQPLTQPFAHAASIDTAQADVAKRRTMTDGN